LVGLSAIVSREFGRAAVRSLNDDGVLGYATAGAITSGLVGLIPYTLARKRGHARLGTLALASSTVAGAAFGLVLGVPVAIVFVVMALRSAAPAVRTSTLIAAPVSATSRTPQAYSWICPACERRVPRTVPVCRCGFDRARTDNAPTDNTSAAPRVTSALSSATYCTECGSSIIVSAKFCSHCGTRVDVAGLAHAG
jgi:hypothetical protein